MTITADIGMPFFLSNKAWYEINESESGNFYLLTEEATQEAIDSYNDYYAKYGNEPMPDEDGMITV